MNNKLYKKMHNTYIKITAILCFYHLMQSIYINVAYCPSSLACALIYSSPLPPHTLIPRM